MRCVYNLIPPVLALGFLTCIPAIAADYSAPVIEIKAIDSTAKDGGIRISARIEDDQSLASVTLYYRAARSKDRYLALPMSPSKDGPGIYHASLSRGTVNAPGVEYYFEARDPSNNVSQEPFPSDPLQFRFTVMKGPSAPREMQAYSFGAGFTFGYISVDDPAGDTQSVYAPGISGSFSYGFARGWRLSSDLNYRSFRLPYSRTHIGQDVDSLHLDLLAQHHTLALGTGHGWFAAGLGMQFNRMHDRGTLEEDGIHFGAEYRDRNTANISAMTGIDFEFNLYARTSAGIIGKYYLPFDGGLEGLSASIYILYRFD